MKNGPLRTTILQPRVPLLRLAPVVFLLSLATSQATHPQVTAKVTSLPIVDRAIEFHGGDIYDHSATELEICSKSGCFEIDASRRGGAFDYTVRGLVRETMREVRSTNDTVRLLEDGRQVEVDAERSAALRDWVSARVYFPFLPYTLNDDSVYKQDMGRERWGNEDLHKVKVTFVEGSSTDADDEYLYWFDPETGRLVQFAYSYSGSPGGLRFRRGSNYRRVGGLLFFDQENLSLEGDGLGVDQITPELVATMPLVSTVILQDIQVSPGE